MSFCSLLRLRTDTHRSFSSWEAEENVRSGPLWHLAEDVQQFGRMAGLKGEERLFTERDKRGNSQKIYSSLNCRPLLSRTDLFLPLNHIDKYKKKLKTFWIYQSAPRFNELIQRVPERLSLHTAGHCQLRSGVCYFDWPI